MFEFVEEALDQVALSIERVVDRALDLTVAAGGDVSSAAAAFDQIDDSAGIIAAVGNEIAIRLKPFEQDRSDGFVG